MNFIMLLVVNDIRKLFYLIVIQIKIIISFLIISKIYKEKGREREREREGERKEK